MHLNLAQCKTVAYIFGHLESLGEMLFHYGAFHMARSVFYSLAPGQRIHPNVVNAMILLAAVAASRRFLVRTWFLPSTFATAVLAGAPLGELDEAYADSYMAATKSLRHVFVPVAEPDCAWYLLLIDLKKLLVFSLDVYRSAVSTAKKKADIETLRHVVGSIFLLERHLWNFPRYILDPSLFGDVCYPDRIPHDLSRLALNPLNLRLFSHGFTQK
ncbi:hypothetical protein PIB30_073656, partial [Stylosanthes scabra]|nr:hypothetical protein [Stylosanthes scabra]